MTGAGSGADAAASASPLGRTDKRTLPRVCLSSELFAELFATLRTCGDGRRECQVLLLSSWKAPDAIVRTIHPVHRAHGGGFEVDHAWLTQFWNELDSRGEGVRVQVHTHPGEAFHSPTDDAWPMIHTPGFLSLVIPRFATGAISLRGSYLTEIRHGGGWVERDPRDVFEID
jgi:hypothetical protein